MKSYKVRIACGRNHLFSRFTVRLNLKHMWFHLISR